jgi:hypothetical protein
LYFPVPIMTAATVLSQPVRTSTHLIPLRVQNRLR